MTYLWEESSLGWRSFLFLRERSELNECWSQHWKALLSSLLGKEEVVEALVTDWETEVMSNSIAENILGTAKNPAFWLTLFIFEEVTWCKEIHQLQWKSKFIQHINRNWIKCPCQSVENFFMSATTWIKHWLNMVITLSNPVVYLGRAPKDWEFRGQVYAENYKN